MSEIQNNGINNSAAGINAATTAQTAAEGSFPQNSYNTANAGAPAATVYPAVQQPYTIPGYTQSVPVYAQYQPVQNGSKPHRFSTPARIIMWICGAVAAITLLFGCVVLWILGLKAIKNSISSSSSHSYSESSPGGSDNFGNYGGFPDYGEYGSILPYTEDDDPSAETQSSNAGIGVKVTEIQLEFVVEDKYNSGLIIVEINDDSSFKGTEVRENDLIVAMDGIPTTGYDKLKELLSKKRPGDSATFTIARYEKGIASTFTVTVNLIELSGD